MSVTKMTTRDRTMIMMAMVPPIALLLFCVTAAAKWKVVRSEIRPQLERTLAAELIDSPSPIAADYQMRRSGEDHYSISQLAYAIDALNDKYHLMFAVLQDADRVEGEVKWLEDFGQERPIDAYIHSYLDEAAPLLRRARELGLAPENVRGPSEVGNPHSYTQTNSLLLVLPDLLQTEFRAAVRDGESQRAIDAFRMYTHLDLLPTWSRWGDLLPSVRDSFTTGVWSEEEIKELTGLINQLPDPTEHWEATNRRVLLDQTPWIVDGVVPLDGRRQSVQMTHAPSRRLQWLKRQQEYSNVKGIGTVKAIREVREIEKDYENNSETSLDVSLQVPVNWYSFDLGGSRSGNATSYARVENERRYARAAAAIAQYKIRFESYPDRLEELSRVGLSLDNTLDPTGRPFWYESDDQGCRLGNASQRFTNRGGRPVSLDSYQDIVFFVLRDFEWVTFGEGL